MTKREKPWERGWVLSSIVWNIPVFKDKSSQQSFHGNTLTTKKIKMEESEGVRFDLFHLFSFYLAVLLNLTLRLLTGKKDKSLNLQPVMKLSNIWQISVSVSTLKYNYNFNK
jgi:hypothetical protein